MGVSFCDGEAMRRRGRNLTEWGGEVDEETGRKVDVGLRVHDYLSGPLRFRTRVAQRYSV